MGHYCIDFLQHIEACTQPENWKQASQRVTHERATMEEWLVQNTHLSLYGITTLPGHMDHATLSSEQLNNFQHELLENHHIGRPPYFDLLTSRCIGYSKIQHVANGGTCLTPQLFEHCIQTVTNTEFHAQIPMHSSYSCGDVIPAAHWAMAILEHNDYLDAHDLQPKEGMTLINGSFVHTGVALALLPLLSRFYKTYSHVSAMHFGLTNGNISNNYIVNTTNNNDPYCVGATHSPTTHASTKDIQDPTSVRCHPHILGSLIHAITHYCQMLDNALLRQSDNPLWDNANLTMNSQGSFLDPILSLATGTLIEAILLAMWNSKERIHTALDGSTHNIPINGSTNDDMLGFIQVPKRMTAILERSRMLSGRRIFASGNTTSYGTEDIWSHGLTTCEQLSELCRAAIDMLENECTVYSLCAKRFNTTLCTTDTFAPFSNIQDHFTKGLAECSVTLEKLSRPKPLFPFCK